MLFKIIAINNGLIVNPQLELLNLSRFVLDSTQLIDILSLVANGSNIPKRKYVFDHNQHILAVGLPNDKERHENIAYDCIRIYVDFHVYGGYLEIYCKNDAVCIEISGRSVKFDEHIDLDTLKLRRISVAQHIQRLLGAINSQIVFEGAIVVVVIKKADIKIPS